MEEKKTQDKSGINLRKITIHATRYSVTGEYGSYVFQAVVVDGDSIYGIDYGCIDVLHIQKTIESNGRDSEGLFDYDCGWDAGSDKTEDVEAYKRIREFLENLPLDRPNDMMGICDV